MQQQALQLPQVDGYPVRRDRRVATVHGFSLHADTAVIGNDKDRLGRLVRYGARGPLAEGRLRPLADGRYEYTPKRGTPFTLTP